MAYHSVLHVVFQDVVRKIENVAKGAGDKPAKDVLIADSGSLPVDTPFAVPKDGVKG